MTPLASYRVIDLTDERGLYCSTMLGDLGADVVRVEPPAGSPARRSVDGALWEAWARNSRSVVFDIETAAGRDGVLELAAAADFFVESGPPGELARLGLGYDSLASVNPALVYVSITPFGQAGPRAHEPATDLTIQAASGMMIGVGSPDRPPLRLFGSQAWAHAGAEGAVGALLAHHERARSGRGQHVDVSAQSATALAAGFQPLAGVLDAEPTRRTGGAIIAGDVDVPTVYRARDGFVCAPFFFGPGQGPFARRLMEWIHDSGECDAATRDKDWIGYLDLLSSGEEPQAEFFRVLDIVRDFVASRNVDDLFTEARKRGVQLVPAHSVDGVLADEQLQHRGYWWVAREHPSSPRVPGAFARMSVTPLEHRRPAPAFPSSEASRTHALAEVHRELRPAPEWASGSSSRPVLDGLKVLDFTWLAAGPISSRVLADYGATVVKVESDRRFDAMRILPPHIEGRTDQDSGGGFHSACAGKLSLNLDMKQEGAVDVALDLVRWADVLIESFSPRAMPAWGLDFETLTEVNPALIMVSSSLFGQDGPYATMGGIGYMGAALGGFTRLTGWPDRDPTGPSGPYTDYIAPRSTVAALLAALDHRRRTGEGQWIDVGQIEASLGFLGPELVDFALNATMPEPLGNRHPAMAPHGVYATAGEESWIAVACRNDDDWRRLCGVIDRNDLAAHPQFSSFGRRKEQEDRVDDVVAEWAASVIAAQAERRLVAAGVPGAAVIDHRTVASEHQFSHRDHILDVDHPLHGHTYVESTHIALSRTPGFATVAGPRLGEHTGFVLQELLGYSETRVRELVQRGVVATSSSVTAG